MTFERNATATSLMDVLDRVLDKGIVIDAWMRVSLVGVNLITMEARVVVASFETYVQHASDIAHVTALPTLPTPAIHPPRAFAPVVSHVGSRQSPRRPLRTKN